MYTLPYNSWIANSDLGGSSCPDAILDDWWSTGDEPRTDEDLGWKALISVLQGSLRDGGWSWYNWLLRWSSIEV